MEINNFDCLKKIFNFDTWNILYCLCTIKDSKKIYHTYFIKSYEELLKLKDEIIMLCKLYNATAVLDITPDTLYNYNKYLLRKLSNAFYRNSAEIETPNEIVHKVIRTEYPLSNIIVEVTKNNKEAILKWLDNYFCEDSKLPFCSEGYRNYLRAIVKDENYEKLIVLRFNTERFHLAFPEVNLSNTEIILYNPPLFKCQKCGGTNIQQKCWVDVNTDKVLDYGDDEFWCTDCHNETDIEEVN